MHINMQYNSNNLNIFILVKVSSCYSHCTLQPLGLKGLEEKKKKERFLEAGTDH